MVSKYNFNRQSKYCYKGTDVLINNRGIQDQAKLDRLEGELTAINLMALQMNPIEGNFDLKHLQAIHKFIFGDIYPFAGQLREEDIAKDGFVFAKALYIESEAEKLFCQLHKENVLKNLELPEFSKRAAYYMAELNVLHPFREGNGRAIREFIRTLALNADYELDWSLVPIEQVWIASIKSVTDETELAEVIKQAVVVNETTDQKSEI